MPSCTGAVHAGRRRSDPETSTMQTRHAPTGDIPSRAQSVGMNLPLARAASSTVWPSWALTSSPSMRKDNFFGATIVHSFLSNLHGLDVAAKTAAGLLQRLLMTEPGDDLFTAGCAHLRWQGSPLVAERRARLPRRNLAVPDFGEEAWPAIGLHQFEIDAARRLLPIGHGIRDIRCACDHVASRE